MIKQTVHLFGCGIMNKSKRKGRKNNSNVAVPDKYKFIIQLGKALHQYGVPSYKIQIYLSRVAKQKDIEGNFMDTPTWVNFSFFEEDDHTYNYIECVPPGELNLGALSRVVEITNKVLDGTFTFEKAKIEIENLGKKKKKRKDFIQLLCFMMSAGAFSIIMDTSWISAITASVMGAIVFLYTLLSRKSGYISTTLESLASFTTTILTGLLSLVFPGIDISMTILASIIVFIPGLAITTALEEITSRSLVSGTAKLFDALISLFKQFFGVVLGLALLPLIADVNHGDVYNDIPQWVDYIAIPLLALSLLPVFQVRRKDMTLGVVIGFASFTITTLLDFTGIMLSIFIGTISVVILSSLFSKITKSPELVFLTPGIVMLVPGSKAFIGLSTMFLDPSVSGNSNMGEQVAFIFMGIIGGLIFSGAFTHKRISR